VNGLATLTPAALHLGGMTSDSLAFWVNITADLVTIATELGLAPWWIAIAFVPLALTVAHWANAPVRPRRSAQHRKIGRHREHRTW
jgi:membrane protein implicated in regulation of membrane protease activity